MTAPTIARLVRRGSEPGIRVALERLVATGTVLAERIGRQVEYRPNTDHAAWGAIAAAIHFADSFLDVLDAAIADTVAEAGLAAFVTCAVFGSVATGTAGPHSDIDLVLVVDDDGEEAGHELSERLRARLVLLTGNEANILVLTRTMEADLVARQDPLADSWRENARTIVGPALLTQHAES
ncbi:nucleotidyltransferase domain-containing protein [Klenkia sp. LSe6-5]|uniref:Nucleotidyltransferase domain-containing protein n=1 Tax=Klenkia sesuvii TaxID=3103137 RepID=A0ABU8DVF1_9ACTN